MINKSKKFLKTNKSLNNITNDVWKGTISHCLKYPDYVVSPRGMEVKEVINGRYFVPMPAYLDLDSRKANLSFMFAEASWIVSGSNRLSDISPYMGIYKKFSDDNVFLRGAYGPKVVDQLGYVVDSLENDLDSRQAVINIWRERPGVSRDIPCTTSMQFLIRDNKLNMIATMRSQDIILGFTYDVFTFSMVAKAVQLLLKDRGINVSLGMLHVNVGSLHIYKEYYDKAKKWSKSNLQDETISKKVVQLSSVVSYEGLIEKLNQLSNEV